MSGTYLFVISSFGAGGAERSLLNFLPYLERAGIVPVVCALRRAEVGFEEEVRATGHRVELIGTANRILQVFRLRRLIRELRPSLVYTALFDADLAGRLAAVGTGVPVVSGLVNTAYVPARSLDTRVKPWRLAAVRFIDSLTGRLFTTHFHAISHAAKSSAVEHLGIAGHKVTVVERGRDGTLLGTRSAERRAAVRRQESIPMEATVFITVGRQEYQKGHRFLLMAMATVREADPSALLLIVGRAGNTSGEVNNLVAEHSLDEAVRLLGHRDNVPDLLAASDVFVFPSLFEGLGGAAIEAMALGLPVIASDIPALREATGGESAAVLVPPGHAELLAEAMLTLSRDRTKREQLGAGGRRAFLERFQSEDAHRRLFELLERIAKTSRSGGEKL
ncbi:MAG: glycosyltransferase family 4 protein [Actinobacteria bacterium]|nr:glycosyltransferase family 4 protein [Actinomycetota bacterium]